MSSRRIVGADLLPLMNMTDLRGCLRPLPPLRAHCAHVMLSQGADADANGASAASPPTDPELEAARKAERERRAVKVSFDLPI